MFALRGVDMTKIESRPMRQGIAAAVEHEPATASVPAGHNSNGASASAGAQKRFDYLFYVDLVGGLGDDVIQNALRHLQVRQPRCYAGASWGYISPLAPWMPGLPACTWRNEHLAAQCTLIWHHPLASMLC